MHAPKTLSILAVLCASLICAACSPITVRQETEPEVSVSSFRTFAWAPHAQLQQPAEFAQRWDNVLDDTIKMEVDAILANKGYVLSQDPAHADLRVAYAVQNRNELDVMPWWYSDGYPPFWTNGMSGEIVQTQEGTVTIDLMDARTGKVIWRGIAAEPVSQAGASQQQIKRAVADILNPLPATQVASTGPQGRPVG